MDCLLGPGPVELREPSDARCDGLMTGLLGESPWASASAYCGGVSLDQVDGPQAYWFFVTDAAAGAALPGEEPEKNTAELHCTLNSTDWRKDGVQKLALLSTGSIYGNYRERVGACDRWCFHDADSEGRSAGIVFLKDWGCILAFTNGRLVHVRWLTGKDYSRSDAPGGAQLFMGARIHGQRRVTCLDLETAQRSLSPVCLGWRIALPSAPRITLATMGSQSRSAPFVPMSCVRLRPRDVIHFYLDSKWPGGGGYNLTASHELQDVIDVTRFPTDGSPGQWRVIGEDSDLEQMLERGNRALPGTFSLSTLEFYSG